jgi:hypothetical protein
MRHLFRNARRVATGLVCLAAFGAGAPTIAHADDLSDAFAAVLAHPADPKANLRYAQIAEEKGEIRKALTAYERVLAADPDNDEARVGYTRARQLLEPPSTRYAATFGTQYNQNVRLVANNLNENKKADLSLAGSLNVADSRTLGDHRLASNAYLFRNVHIDNGSIDLSYLQLQSGPQFILSDGSTLRVGPSVEASLLDNDFLFAGGGLVANLEPADGPLERLDFTVSYQDFGSRWSDRDAVVVAARGYFLWTKLFGKEDQLFVEPSYVLNATTGSSDEYHFNELGTRIGYYVPIAHDAMDFQRIMLLPEVLTFLRPYQGSEPGQGSDRKDAQVIGGIRVVGSRLMGREIDASLGYARNQNFSNYSDRQFGDNQVLATVTLRF